MFRNFMMYKFQYFISDRESNILPQNHRQKVVNETLFIEKVQKTHDIGQYICTAKNSNGQGMSSNVYVSVLGRCY